MPSSGTSEGRGESGEPGPRVLGRGALVEALAQERVDLPGVVEGGVDERVAAALVGAHVDEVLGGGIVA